MSSSLPPRVLSDLTYAAKKYGVKKVTLFGSRARKTNHERSDIDIAVSGGDFYGFSEYMNEEARTLLSFDIVQLDKGISEELQTEIDRDGVVVYEKI